LLSFKLVDQAAAVLRAMFDYESIGGHKYRSRITLNHHVITSFQFEEITA